MLLIEPDRGVDRERLREESHITERGGKEGDRITCDSLAFLSTHRPCMAEGRGEGTEKEGSHYINGNMH